MELFHRTCCQRMNTCQCCLENFSMFSTLFLRQVNNRAQEQQDTFFLQSKGSIIIRWQGIQYPWLLWLNHQAHVDTAKGGCPKQTLLYLWLTFINLTWLVKTDNMLTLYITTQTKLCIHPIAISGFLQYHENMQVLGFAEMCRKYHIALGLWQNALYYCVMSSM